MRDLAVCMKTKHFFMFWKKPGISIPDLYLYNIKIQTNIDQNAVKYLRKITDFFWNNFWRNFFFLFFGLGWTQPPMWLDPTKPCTRKILRVHILPSHCSSFVFSCTSNSLDISKFILLCSNSWVWERKKKVTYYWVRS